MLDLSTISPEVITARGEYSTVRAAHEDAKKKLSEHCGRLASAATQILRRMQPDNDAVPMSVAELMELARSEIEIIERLASDIESLATQRYKLKTLAWSK